MDQAAWVQVASDQVALARVTWTQVAKVLGQWDLKVTGLQV